YIVINILIISKIHLNRKYNIAKFIANVVNVVLSGNFIVKKEAIPIAVIIFKTKIKINLDNVLFK
ncbi:hypothetical protein, partial [Acinetobacter nosocomialis]|uniref:hypothetical protein n=1 Tax=Acinetobacter nosocomialis TaxID=106654 RepID=UPI0032B5EBEB